MILVNVLHEWVCFLSLYECSIELCHQITLWLIEVSKKKVAVHVNEQTMWNPAFLTKLKHKATDMKQTKIKRCIIKILDNIEGSGGLGCKK